MDTTTTTAAAAATWRIAVVPGSKTHRCELRRPPAGHRLTWLKCLRWAERAFLGIRSGAFSALRRGIHARFHFWAIPIFGNLLNTYFPTRPTSGGVATRAALWRRVPLPIDVGLEFDLATCLLLRGLAGYVGPAWFGVWFPLPPLQILSSVSIRCGGWPWLWFIVSSTVFMGDGCLLPQLWGLWCSASMWEGAVWNLLIRRLAWS